jgi:hypothetical protein
MGPLIISYISDCGKIYLFIPPRIADANSMNSTDYRTGPTSSHRTTSRPHALHADSQFSWADVDQFHDLRPPPCEQHPRCYPLRLIFSSSSDNDTA